MDENPYKAPLAFVPLRAEIELARLQSRLKILKPVFATASGLATLAISVAIIDHYYVEIVGAVILIGLWFVVGLGCARTLSKLEAMTPA